MTIGLIQYQEYNVLIYILVASPLISRKLFWGSLYLFQLKNFTRLLNTKIRTEDEFRIVWSSYCHICNTDNHMRMIKGGIYVKYYILKLILNVSLESHQINAQTGTFEKDQKYQEDLLFKIFTSITCDFASSYDVKNHDIIGTKQIEEPLSQISFEPVLIKIIMDCHNDGKGFLSALALMQSIMIYIRLPDDKKTLVTKFFKDISDIKIGWLNRRIFEVAVATVMIERLPEERLRELNIELRNTKIVTDKDKYEFRDNVLTKKMLSMGLKIC